MDIFQILSFIGGLSLFLYGMQSMGEALTKRAGSALNRWLHRLTQHKWLGFFTGLGITALIQSSSATTVMVVGFVNAGLLSLRQAIHVIMGANIGTTITAWFLSLVGIDSANVFVKLLKPASFAPMVALVGIILYLFYHEKKKRDSGQILLGFAMLLFGMEMMSDAVSGLRQEPAFHAMFTLFTHPLAGVAAGGVLTAIIQSSSASVGILQALAVTGEVSYGAAIPIILGQNIGTCVTAMLSAIGTDKNAKRAAMVHLSFNVIGTVVWLSVFLIARAILQPSVLDIAATPFGIALAHTIFNVLSTAILFPFTATLERLVIKLVPSQ